MKTIFISIFFIFILQSFYGQNSFNEIIDEFIIANEVYKPKQILFETTKYDETEIIPDYNNGIISFIMSYNDSIHIKTAMEYIENNYNKNSNPWIKKAISHIYAGFLNNFNLPIFLKQIIVLNCLNNYPIFSDLYLNVDSSCFSNLSLNRISYLLNNKPTEYEAEFIATISFGKGISPYDTLNNPKLSDFYKRKATENYLTVEQWCDSLNKNAIIEEKNKNLNHKYYLNESFVYLIDNGNLYNFFPKLEIMLHDKYYYDIHYAIKLVLGKNKYKNYDSLMAWSIVNDDFSYNSERLLFYIRTQESFFAYSTYLISDEIIDCCGIGNEYSEKKKVGYYVIISLSEIIENFPYEFKKTGNYFEDCFCKLTNNMDGDDLEKAFEWMKVNKGKYLIKE